MRIVNRGRFGLALVVVTAALVFASATGPALATVAPVPVKTTTLWEDLPSAGKNSGNSDAYFAWSQNSVAHPKHYDAFLDVNGAGATKLNAPNTFGYGAGIDDTTLILQQVPNASANSDLFLFDISTSPPTASATPPGIDNGAWQWGPTISGDYILYGENSPSGNYQRVVLYKISTGAKTILATSKYKAFAAIQGQVNGDYAVYYKRFGGVWNVYRYQISSATVVNVPNPHNATTYSPAVTADGTVYFVRSNPACGDLVRISRWAPGDPAPTVVYRLPAGYDNTNDIFAFNDGASTSVYFDRYNCAAKASNVYYLPGADTASPPAPAPVAAGPSVGEARALPRGARPGS